MFTAIHTVNRLLLLLGLSVSLSLPALADNLPLKLMPNKTFADVQAEAQFESVNGPVYGNAPDPATLPFHATLTGTVMADATMTKLAIFSDDGCDVIVDGVKVWAGKDIAQGLPDLPNSLHELPITLTPGAHTVEIDYSNVIYNLPDPQTGNPTDIDGCTLFVYGAAGSTGPPSFSVTVNPGQVSPNPAAVGQQMTATLSATPNNPPVTTAQATVTGPTWTWAVALVETSQDGTTFTTAPAASYTINISQSDPTNPAATFTATLNQAAYYRVKVTATAAYHSVPTDGSAASDIPASDTEYVIGIGPSTSGNSSSGISTHAHIAHTAANTPHTSLAPVIANGRPFTAGTLLIATNLRIFRGTIDVTNSNLSVMVGEGISLTAKVIPAFESVLFPSLIDDGSEYTWAAGGGGTAVGGFSVPDDMSRGGPVPLGNLDRIGSPMSGSSFHLYWAGTPQTVMSALPNITLTDSQLLTPPSTVTFNVGTSTATMSAVLKPETVDFNFNKGAANQYKLHLGIPSDPRASDGIIWTFNVDNSIGHYEMIQLINPEIGSVTLKTGGVTNEQWIPGSAGTFPALDTIYPYTADITTNSTDGDSPGFVLDNDFSSVTFSDAFTDYLMFHPNTPDWCWVPLGTMVWTAGGVGTNPERADGSYTDVWQGSHLVPLANGTNPAYVPSGTNVPFPIWADNITSFQFR